MKLIQKLDKEYQRENHHHLDDVVDEDGIRMV